MDSVHSLFHDLCNIVLQLFPFLVIQCKYLKSITLSIVRWIIFRFNILYFTLYLFSIEVINDSNCLFSQRGPIGLEGCTETLHFISEQHQTLNSIVTFNFVILALSSPLPHCFHSNASQPPNFPPALNIPKHSLMLPPCMQQR